LLSPPSIDRREAFCFGRRGSGESSAASM